MPKFSFLFLQHKLSVTEKSTQVYQNGDTFKAQHEQQILRLNNTYYLGLIWRRQWHPTPVLLPGKSHGQRSLVGCGPCRLRSMGSLRVGYNWASSLSLFTFMQGNGNPLQCSCLENPRDGGAWWAIYGVAQSRTRLKQLSSSSSMWLWKSNKNEDL